MFTDSHVQSTYSDGADNPEKFFERNEDLRVRKAFEMASIAHSNQFDKAGKKYIFHPMTVALGCKGDISAMIVALLHDVAEDTAFSLEDLKEKISLTSKEFDALKLLTHEENVSYFDYIERIKTNELATKVKIADLKHNSDLSRIPEDMRTEKDLARVEKYKKALKILSENTKI